MGVRPIYSTEHLIVLPYKYYMPAPKKEDYVPIKSVLELEDYIFVSYYDKIITHNKRTHQNKYNINVGNYDMAIYDIRLFKLFRASSYYIYKYYVIDTANDDYIFRDNIADCSNIEDLIKQYIGHHINHTKIIRPVILYDHLWPTYKVNQEAYCDLMIICKK